METDTTVNAALLRQTLDYIKTHPEQWEQSTWRAEELCGTVACFAGWACALNGDMFDPSEWDLVLTDANGKPVDSMIERRAEEILGLTEDQADDLFGAYRTLDELEQIVAELCGNAS